MVKRKHSQRSGSPQAQHNERMEARENVDGSEIYLLSLQLHYS